MTDDVEWLTLQEAADRLRVHYMTAYRWVRRGQLAAFKAGGRLRVRSHDLERFINEREVDVALPSGGDRHTDWDARAQHFYGLLLSGEDVEAGRLVRRIVANGAPAGEVYLRLLTPSLHRLGRDWEHGLVTVAVEHRSTEICAAILAQLSDAFRRRGPSRGTAVTLTPPRELHGLAAIMVADFVRAAGYDVHHLGVNLPVEDLQTFLHDVKADLACVSVTTARLAPQTYEAIVDAARRQRTAVIFGGQGAERPLVERAGGRYVDRLDALPRVLHQQVAG